MRTKIHGFLPAVSRGIRLSSVALLGAVGLCPVAFAGFSTAAGTTPGLPAPGAASRMVFGDFNNDGRVDALYQTVGNGTAWAFAQGNANGTFTIYTSTNATGVFANGTSTPFNGVTQFDFTGTGPRLIAGDFNGDGRTDIWFTVNTSSGTILWNGVSGFTSAAGSTYGFPAAGATSRMVAGDFNNDGICDLLYQTVGNGTAWAYAQGSGSGTFTTYTSTNATGAFANASSTPFNGVTQFDFTGTGTALETGDFNGDGRTDIWWHLNNGAGTVLWNGAGGFTSAAGSSYNFPAVVVGADVRLAVGDFDSDGIDDLLYQTNNDGSAWGYAKGNSNGTFTVTTTASLPGTPFSGVTQFDFAGTGATFLTGDVSGDRDDDIWFLVNGSAGTLFTQGGSPPALSSSTPADGATGVSTTTTIAFTFDQTVAKGSAGNITVKKTSDNTTVATIAVTSGSVTGSGATWTVATGVTLASGTGYYVLVDAGSFVNSNGQFYAGIASATALNFTTLSAPAVTNVTATTADGSYKAGATLAITVTFNLSATVTGTPRLQLNSGGAVFANYASGSPGTTLTFNYVVGAGETAADLDYSSTGALTLNSGTIVGTSGGAAATLTLASPGAAGSLGANKALVIDTTAPGAPSTPDLTAGTDSGSSSSDNVTSDTTPTFSGTAEASSTVTLYDTDGTTALGNATATGGNWTITASALSAGGHTVTAKAADAAGNVSSASGGLSITIDATAPSAPSTPDLDVASDTGASSTDDITTDTTPSFSGTAEASSTVTLYDTDGTTAIGNATATGGAWTITASTLSAGSHTVTAKAADAAGNVSSASSGLTVTIDTAAPSAPSITTITTDTGSSASDQVTSDTTLMLAGSAEAGSTVTVSLTGTGVLGTTTTNGGGIWSFDYTGTTLGEGGHTFTATATDVAGNVSAASGNFVVTVDTTAPGAPSTPDLTAGTDSGSSSTDDITSDTTPTFSGTAEASSTVTLYDTDGTTAIGSGTATGGAWTITASTLSEGAHTVTAKTADAAGNVSSASGGLSITIDATAPSAPSTPDLDVASDTGASSTDDITTDTTPSFSGTAEASSTVTLYDTDGTTAIGNATATGGNWAITASTLSAGSHTVTAKAADAAGNVSSASSGLTVTIDTTAPSAPAITTITTDTGSSASDQVTSDPTLVLAGTAEANSTVTVSRTGTGVLGTALATGGGIWSFDYTGTTLGTGSHTFTATATDLAGNASAASGNFVVTVDTTAPSAPSAPDLDVASDTGASSTDNITTDDTPSFNGTAEANSMVTLYDTDGTTAIGSATATGGGAWTITASTLSAGSHTVTAKAADAAGNVSSASSGLSVTIDTAAPSAPALTTITTDTGSSSSDQITSDTTLVLAGTAEAGSTVTVSLTGTGVLGTATTTGGGTWSFDYTSTTLGAGSHTFTATATDVAGNVSAASANFVVTVDTTAPGAPSTPDLTAGTDSGSSSTDDLTNDTTPTFTGTAEASSTVTLYDTDGTTVLGSATATGGNWTITASTLSAGSHTVTAKATDAAGNVGSASSGLGITIDTTAPSAPSTPDLTAGTDSGTSSSDDLTSDTTPTFSGTAEASSTVTLYDTDGTTALGSATATGGAWTITASTLSAGAHTVTAKATDAAGNTGSASGGLSVTIDATAPNAPSTPDLDVASDTGVSGTDNITSDTTPTFSGTAEASSVVTLYDTDGTTVIGTATATGGAWTITASALATGAHTVTAKATDAAGNVSSASGGLSLTIDTTASTVASVGVPANATYLATQNLDFTVNWNESVTVDTSGGTPRIALTIGSGSVNADYVSGSGTAALVFRYTVQVGDLDTNGIAVGALSLNGGTLKDTAGNNATLTLNGVGATTAVLVDAVAPTVSSSTVPANSTYKAGQDLDFTVTYSENVVVSTVGGTPSIGVTLATGGTVQAAYVSGSGTTTLTFRYTIAAGDADTDGIAVASSIALNGGTIKDGTGNDAALTSLGFSATTGVLVDGVAPTVSSSDRKTPAGASTNVTSVVYRVTFAEPVTGVDSSDFALTATGTAAGAVASVNAVSSTVYDVTVNTISGNGTLRLDLKNAGTGIADTPGNAIATGFTAGQTYTIDHIVPTLSTILRQNPATVNTSAATATWRVTFQEGVTGVDATDFTVTVVSGTPSGAITGVTPVSASVYDVAVGSLAGQGRLRLDLKATGAGIADLAGNALADGGFTTGDFYYVGVASVFDATSLAAGTTRSVSNATTAMVAQRFTTAAAAPLSLTTVTAALGAITGSPVPVVTIHADAAGAIDPTVVTTLTNPASLTANALNVWTSTALLSASTTYWVVFADTSVAGAFDLKETAATSGGSGTWLTNPDYAYRYGANAGTGPQAGALQIAIGATSVPAITSALTASGTYKTAFTYAITATNLPTSYAATGLPAGLNLNTGTGAITGAATQTGVFNVSLTATNGSGTGVPSTLVLTVAKAPLTVTASDEERPFGTANPSFTLNYTGLLGGDSAAGLTTAPTATTAAAVASPVGNYAITPAGGVSPNYSFSYVPGALTIVQAAQAISFASIADALIGQSLALNATAGSGRAVTFAVAGGPALLSGGTLLVNGVGTITVQASQAGDGNFLSAVTEQSFMASAGTPTLTTPAHTAEPSAGGTAMLSAETANPNLTYQWQRNGAAVNGATSATFTLADVQPPVAGLYTYIATLPGGGSGVSEPVIVGLTTTQKVIGTGEEIGSNIIHPNGNVYDQLLLEGPATTFTANPGQITRLSFIDLTDDIVQVEFSGAGTVSLVMDGASSPMPAVNYNQPGTNYVKGHAGIVIVGANETSNLSIISVGRINAVNQALFRNDVTYDGIADIAFVAIQSANGKFGGLRTGNVNYFATQGFTGVYAPGVRFMGPVYVGDINAFDAATPVLVLGAVDDARITGGSLFQPSHAVVKVGGLTRLRFVNGTTSHGVLLPAQANLGRLIEEGVDVTDLIVVNP